MMIEKLRRCGQCGAMHHIDQTVTVCPDPSCGATLEWALRQPPTVKVEMRATTTVEVPADGDPFTEGVRAWKDIEGRVAACDRHCRLRGPSVAIRMTSARVVDEPPA